MITRGATLEDVCFAVSAALKANGISCVLTGGSAAVIYAPQAYMSEDADFVLDAEDSLADVQRALATIGFRRDGRSRNFVHDAVTFTVEFPKGPLAVGGDYIHETAVIDRNGTTLRILTRMDCVRDRLAHYYHWNDYTALNAAVGVAAADVKSIDFAQLRRWTERESPTLMAKFDEFVTRVQEAVDS